MAKRISFPRTRMSELQDGGVQGLPSEGSQRGGLGGVARLPAIDRIADDRAAEMGEMDADLVGAAGPQLGAQQAGHGRQRRPEPLSTQYSVTALRPLLVRTAMRLRSTGWRPMAASMVPFWALGPPQTRAL